MDWKLNQVNYWNKGMNTIERINKEYKAIIDGITAIQLHDYNNLGYYLSEWEVTIEPSLLSIKTVEYARVHLFNTVLTPVVNKLVFIKLGIFKEDDFKDETKAPNINGYICLKYPFSQIPQ
jgi:hypothetical protein